MLWWKSARWGALGLGGAMAAWGEAVPDYHLAPEKLAKAEVLYRTDMLTTVAGTLGLLLVLAWWVMSGASAWLRDRVEAQTPRRFGQALLFVPIVLLSLQVVNLPLRLYGRSLALAYGLSVQPWGSWWADWAKAEAVELLMVSGLAWGFNLVIRRQPKRWWLFAWLASIPTALALVFVYPLVVDPLFHEFDRLENRRPQLLPELEKVMRRGGLVIDRSSMFEMKASDKVTTYNAYVTGLGASHRVVVWDSTARELSVPEVMFVFAHEQGHYVLRHIWQGLALTLLGILLGLYLMHRIAGAILARWGARWRIRGPEDWAALPLLALIGALLATVGQPISSAVSREIEHQADVYALEAIRGLVPDSSELAARTFQKLGENSLTYPTPQVWFVAWTYDHRPVSERLRFANRYRPWERGEPMRYLSAGPEANDAGTR